MIRHIVMFKFKEEAEGRSKKENLELTKKIFKNLKPSISVILKDEIKINLEEADKNNYDFIYIADFENLETLNEYAVHPEHVKCINFLKTVRDERAAIDFEI